MEYFGFLTESQKRDREFFERLAEKEVEREIKSQEMMLSMAKEVAKIFKGEWSTRKSITLHGQGIDQQKSTNNNFVSYIVLLTVKFILKFMIFWQNWL